MNDDEYNELRRLRREMESSSLGDRPQSMSALKLQRLINLEAKEIRDYALLSLTPSPSYTLKEIEALARQFITTNGVTRDDSDDDLSEQLSLSRFCAWLARRERKGRDDIKR